jgi:hypothetical protein
MAAVVAAAGVDISHQGRQHDLGVVKINQATS